MALVVSIEHVSSAVVFLWLLCFKSNEQPSVLHIEYVFINFASHESRSQSVDCDVLLVVTTGSAIVIRALFLCDSGDLPPLMSSSL